LDYKSKWIDLSAEVEKSGLARVTYEKRDSLLLVQTIERRKFLFIRYGQKNAWWQACSMDPHTVISGLTIKKIIH
jgi:hypothetical protein